MKILWSWLLGLATVTAAVKVSFKQTNLQRRTGGTALSLHKPNSFAAQSNANGLGLSTVQDIIYMGNVTVGGNAYTVQLDTGSSDLWLKGPTTPLPNSHPTSMTSNLTYGIGWAQGHLSYAQVDFAGITVPSQVFLDASVVQNPALNYGAVGTLGLGFTSLSALDQAVNATGASTGRSLLYNLFNNNPSEPNFISFAFQRSLEPGDDVQGSFAIGEYEPQYAAVANNTPISTFPVNSPKRWTVLVDALLTGGSAVIPSTTIPNAPSNKAVALIDSGTSLSYATAEICNAIYGGIQGASFNTQLNQWEVPCSAEVDIALQIGGQVFPVHPLDVSSRSLSGLNTCVGSFVPQIVSVGIGEFDWLLGDNFLRSVYSIYDFGDFDANHNMGNPYMKMLSLVDPNQASLEFAKLRNSTARTNITYNASNNTAADPGSTSVTVPTDLAQTLDKIGVYFPAMLGVMALNALVLIALVVVGIVYLCRGRRKRARAARIRTPNGRMTPMPRNSYIPGTPPPDQHVYEPVSMAITEDTMFGPSSPGFRKFDGKVGDRPQSLATLPSQSQLYQQIGSEDALIAPSPSFLKGDNRPKSMGMSPSVQPHFSSPTRGEDEPFTPPLLHDSQNADNVSLRSGRSGRSLVDDGPVPSAQTPPFASPSRPASLMNADKPKSILVPSSSIQSPEDVLLPPSPGFSTGFSPSPSRSAASQSPTYPPPQSASPRSSAMRSHAPLAAADRPMSVGMLPSQMQAGDMRFVHPSPPFQRQGSSLRPSAGPDRPMSAILPSPGGMQHIPMEEDITTFTPPAPAFRRSPSGTANDRPMSMA